MPEREICYPGTVKLLKNLIFIEFRDIPSCTIFEYSVDRALEATEKTVTKYLSDQLISNTLLATPTDIKEIPYEETEIARLLVKVKVKGGVVISANIEYCTDYNVSSYFNLVTNIAKPIKKALHNDIEDIYKEPDIIHSDKDYILSRKVYNRLLLRYSILRDIERLERRYSAHSDAFDKEADTKSTSVEQTSTPRQVKEQEEVSSADPNSQDERQVNPAIRAYRLATTDVFVEKAIAYLEDDSDDYKNKGTKSYRTALWISSIGVGFSILGLIESFIRENRLFGFNPAFSPDNATDFLYKILPKFTFYGMLIALAVGLCRYGKAMLDQSERLREKRHALRQGRLFVHLKDGQLDINELDKAFTWNAAMGNAFGNLETETKSPIGGVLSDIKSLTENIAASIAGSKKGSGGAT